MPDGNKEVFLVEKARNFQTNGNEYFEVRGYYVGNNTIESHDIIPLKFKNEKGNHK